MRRVFTSAAIPIEVDIGCGKGRFLIARARAHPDTRFLGIDRLPRRMAKLDARVRRHGLRNVRLLLSEASLAVERLLPAASVSVFYLFFPDPWPKRRHHRRRLCGPGFLDSVHRALAPDGQIHIATDHEGYFEAMRALFANDPRFTPLPPFEPSEEERTDFEVIFLGQGARIGRASFRRK